MGYRIAEFMMHISIAKQKRAISEMLAEVEALRTWGEDWEDGEATPPGDAAIKRARQWLKEMYRDVTSDRRPWLEPMITASEEGEVTFEWWCSDRKVTVFVSGAEVTVTKLTGTRPPFQIEDDNASTRPRRRKLWIWLLGE
jgi:hypothetical protein